MFICCSRFTRVLVSNSDTFQFHEEPIRACPWDNVRLAPVNRQESMKKSTVTCAEVSVPSFNITNPQ